MKQKEIKADHGYTGRGARRYVHNIRRGVVVYTCVSKRFGGALIRIMPIKDFAAWACNCVEG